MLNTKRWHRDTSSFIRQENDLQGAKHGSEASELVKLRDTIRDQHSQVPLLLQDYLHFNEIP